MPDLKIKLLFVSRDVPLQNFHGSGNLVLSFLKFLNENNFIIDYILLEPNFGCPLPIVKIPNYINLKCINNKKLGHYFIDLRPRQWLNFFYMMMNERAPSIFKKLLAYMRNVYKQKIKKNNTLVDGIVFDSYPNEKELEFINELYQSTHPDVVIVNYAWLSSILDKIPKEACLRAILTHDVLCQRYQSYQDKGFASDQFIKTKEEELNELMKAELILAVQSEDAKWFKENLPFKEVEIVPFTKELKEGIGHEIVGRCLYVGSGTDHNVIGITWFLKHVWPAVIQENLSAHLHIAGTVCQKLSIPYPNVRYLGHVNNLDAEYDAAQVCVIPFQVGSGLKIKLIEALSYGKACVSTSIGIQGIREIEGKAVLVGDSPEDFAKAMIEILRNNELKSGLENEACKFITNNFSPEAVYRPFVNIVHKHLRHSDSSD
jgi:glycosyltransferase involved in cell wall biosynthesis